MKEEFILVDLGFWDKDGNYREDKQEINIKELKNDK